MKHIWLVLGVGVLLLGCSAEEHEGLKNWMKEQARDMRPQLQPLPPLASFPLVEYATQDLVDPFQASRLEPEKKAGKGIGPDPNWRKEPLEAYPLEALKMVGMMMMKGQPAALILADKTVHQVKVGNHLGQNFGVVTKITESELSLKELIEDPNGDWVEQVSTIQLQEQEAKK